MKNRTVNSGFTLVETLVGVAVFLVIATATYKAYVSLFSIINLNQYKIVALNLANEQFEIIRNLSYADVGIPNSIPNGKIPHVQSLVRSGYTFIATTTIRNIDLPFDGQIGSTTKPDLSPADNKGIEIEIGCPQCKNFTPITLTTTVAPKNLETASTNGSVLIKVFDSNGVPVSNANVHIVNSKVTPNIIIDDVTDIDGFLQVVDAPPGTNAYQITVSKSGYSTDRTYTTGVSGNPTPTKPDATVILQQLTPISFAIDKLSTLSFSSVTPACVAVGGINFSLTGAKNIGTNISKYFQSLGTNGSGVLSLSNMEWDSYTMKPTSTIGYDIAGFNPLNPVTVNAGASQQEQLVVVPHTSNSLLVTVKDSLTQLPVSDATVILSRTGYSEQKITGKGYINQTDWSGGQGQTDYLDTSKYSTYYRVNVSANPGEIRLNIPTGTSTYSQSGSLQSSTFDTGSASNFNNLIWAPSDTPVAAGSGAVWFKIATATTSSATTTWTFRGPSGTTASNDNYTVSNSVINSIHNGDRYLRYMLNLHTDSTSVTPNISDIAFTFTSSCQPPGQVFFSGISTGTYNISVSRSGYNTQSTIPVTVGVGWMNLNVSLQATSI